MNSEPRAAPLRILELRSVRGTGGGPEKTILFGAATMDPARATVLVCYVRDRRDNIFRIDERARALGVEYVELLESHSFDLSVVSALKRLVRERSVDIIHSHDYKTDLLAWIATRGRRTAIISTAHGWTGHSWRERRVYYPAGRRLLTRFPLVLAVSSEIRQQLLRAGARDDRVRVLLNGIDHETWRRDRSCESQARARFGLDPKAVVVGSVGRLEPQKRFDLLIAACARVRQTVPELVLVIAGDGGERVALEQYVAEHGHADWCRLLGHRDDVVDLHHTLDLFVQSSTYEGTPNVVLEAMALETPIVATDVGGTVEVCRPDLDGMIVPAGNPEALAGAIIGSLLDKASAGARVRSARQRVETDLSFVSRVRALEHIYEELMSCGRP